jgi:hypothetical protein
LGFFDLVERHAFLIRSCTTSRTIVTVAAVDDVVLAAEAARPGITAVPPSCDHIGIAHRPMTRFRLAMTP